jgi:hypothetical protein
MKRIGLPFQQKVVVQQANAVGEPRLYFREMLCRKVEKVAKDLYVLCGEMLVSARLTAEKREQDGYVSLTCKIVSVDFEALPPARDISKKLVFYGRSPTDEEMVGLIKEAIGEISGVVPDRIIPVSDRYVENHRRLVDLKKGISKGGSK